MKRKDVLKALELILPETEFIDGPNSAETYADYGEARIIVRYMKERSDMNILYNGTIERYLDRVKEVEIRGRNNLYNSLKSLPETVKSTLKTSFNPMGYPEVIPIFTLYPENLCLGMGPKEIFSLIEDFSGEGVGKEAKKRQKLAEVIGATNPHYKDSFYGLITTLSSNLIKRILNGNIELSIDYSSGSAILRLKGKGDYNFYRYRSNTFEHFPFFEVVTDNALKEYRPKLKGLDFRYGSLEVGYIQVIPFECEDIDRLPDILTRFEEFQKEVLKRLEGGKLPNKPKTSGVIR